MHTQNFKQIRNMSCSKRKWTELDYEILLNKMSIKIK